MQGCQLHAVHMMLLPELSILCSYYWYEKSAAFGLDAMRSLLKMSQRVELQCQKCIDRRLPFFLRARITKTMVHEKIQLRKENACATHRANGWLCIFSNFQKNENENHSGTPQTTFGMQNKNVHIFNVLKCDVFYF